MWGGRWGHTEDEKSALRWRRVFAVAHACKYLIELVESSYVVVAFRVWGGRLLGQPAWLAG